MSHKQYNTRNWLSLHESLIIDSFTKLALHSSLQGIYYTNLRDLTANPNNGLGDDETYYGSVGWSKRLSPATGGNIDLTSKPVFQQKDFITPGLIKSEYGTEMGLIMYMYLDFYVSEGFININTNSIKCAEISCPVFNMET